MPTCRDCNAFLEKDSKDAQDMTTFVGLPFNICEELGELEEEDIETMALCGNGEYFEAKE